ncbi:hypothetical protein JW752_04535 [Candidatus Peregrinibacteria bacterium]|nr:hypothetical protein [Candidatus Peregrinibacteria bacterium]
MKSLTAKSILIITFVAIAFLPGCGGGTGTESVTGAGSGSAKAPSSSGRDVSALKCGDVLSKAFVDSLGLPDSESYAEDSSVPCVFTDVSFMFWPGDLFDTLLQGVQMLPDPENFKETTSIGSRTMEYDGSYLGHTVEVGFVTKNKNATALLSFTGDAATLELAKKMAKEMEKNL